MFNFTLKTPQNPPIRNTHNKIKFMYSHKKYRKNSKTVPHFEWVMIVKKVLDNDNTKAALHEGDLYFAYTHTSAFIYTHYYYSELMIMPRQSICVFYEIKKWKKKLSMWMIIYDDCCVRIDTFDIIR